MRRPIGIAALDHDWGVGSNPTFIHCSVEFLPPHKCRVRIPIDRADAPVPKICFCFPDSDHGKLPPYVCGHPLAPLRNVVVYGATITIIICDRPVSSWRRSHSTPHTSLDRSRILSIAKSVFHRSTFGHVPSYRALRDREAQGFRLARPLVSVLVLVSSLSD